MLEDDPNSVELVAVKAEAIAEVEVPVSRHRAAAASVEEDIDNLFNHEKPTNYGTTKMAPSSSKKFVSPSPRICAPPAVRRRTERQAEVRRAIHHRAGLLNHKALKTR